MQQNLNMYPILIGSRAAETNNEGSDYDIIIPSIHNTDDYINKLNTNVDFFTRKYDLELLEYLNKTEHTIKTINDIDFIIPSKEIISMIYLSSILRIIPYTEDQETNIQIWLKRVKTYNTIRSHINYIEFDKELYSGSFIGNQFKQRANDKFEQYGDTPISLDKTETEFFKDNVPRIFDHDWLHKQVGLMCRNSTDLLFPKLQKEGSVGIDKELFDNTSTEFKISMIQEEVITLMLERKIIPSIEINGDYTIEQYYGDINNISAHFATNLCGQGFHFLRKYVLDHFNMIMEFKVEPNNIINLGLKLMNKEKKDEPKTYPKMSEETEKLYEILRNKIGKNIWNIRDTILDLSTGRGKMISGTEFYLDIKMIDKTGCLFKQYLLKKNIERVEKIEQIEQIDGFLVAQKENIITESITEEVTKVWKSGYLSSVSLCTGREDYYYGRGIKETKKIEKKFHYYLNSYGSIKNLPHCENITKILLEYNGTYIDTDFYDYKKEESYREVDSD